MGAGEDSGDSGGRMAAWCGEDDIARPMQDEPPRGKGRAQVKLLLRAGFQMQGNCGLWPSSTGASCHEKAGAARGFGLPKETIVRG